MLFFMRSHVTMKPDWAELFVAKQKNDPSGLGMVCVVPRISALGPACPAAMLGAWVAAWDARGITEGPLFYTTGKKVVLPVSSDNWRKSWSAKMSSDSAVGTHNLRKGGAKWYRSSCRCPEDAVQVQGGRAHRETMQQVYVRATQEFAPPATGCSEYGDLPIGLRLWLARFLWTQVSQT